MVLAAARLALARHSGWGWSCPGRPWLWLEVTWPEAQPEFAGLGLAVCCVEAGFGVVGAPGSQAADCKVCGNNWSVPCSAIGACLKPRWAGLGGQSLFRDHNVWMGLSVESVLSSTLFSLPFFSSLFWSCVLFASVLGRSPCSHVLGAGSTVGFVQFPCRSAQSVQFWQAFVPPCLVSVQSIWAACHRAVAVVSGCAFA